MEMDCPECSYEYYEKSFKKNFEHHIESLERYTGAKSVGIFLVEQSGSPITILKDNKFADFYHLQMDASLLDYLYQYKDKAIEKIKKILKKILLKHTDILLVVAFLMKKQVMHCQYLRKGINGTNFNCCANA